MKLSEFDYQLPQELIAQTPTNPRDHSRLLVLHRATGKIEHQHFFDIKKYLRPGDVVVLNNTKVIPARLIGQKPTGGKVEVFLLKNNKMAQSWECLISGLKNCKEVLFKDNVVANVLADNQNGTFEVRFNLSAAKFEQFLNKQGAVPLPPYIKAAAKTDKARYQTVFANDHKKGSVAAPTAGLHFTKKLIADLKNQGVQFEEVTLQVGLGTFASVKTEDIKKHQMHSEWFEIGSDVFDRIKQAKKEGRRIITVGTTATRTLEAVFASGRNKQLAGYTDIFIYPGYKFGIVDALITNFHVPKSTLLMLVSAFAQNGRSDNKSGLKKIQKAYQEAVTREYKFFSYGDAMLIV